VLNFLKNYCPEQGSETLILLDFFPDSSIELPVIFVEVWDIREGTVQIALLIPRKRGTTSSQIISIQVAKCNVKVAENGLQHLCLKVACNSVQHFFSNFTFINNSCWYSSTVGTT